MCFYQKNAAGIFELSILLSVSAVCRAEFVPVERASVVASNFFHSNDATPNSVNRRMELYQCDESVSTKSHEDYPSYYIFQGENGKGILTDAEIQLTIYGSQKGFPEHLRLVRFSKYLWRLPNNKQRRNDSLIFQIDGSKIIRDGSCRPLLFSYLLEEHRSKLMQ